MKHKRYTEAQILGFLKEAEKAVNFTSRPKAVARD
jgi:hypothetical protein